MSVATHKNLGRQVTQKHEGVTYFHGANLRLVLSNHALNCDNSCHGNFTALCGRTDLDTQRYLG
jgi:hypothetical protein